ncbi:MAG: hypothetical protein LBL23_01995 [Coriobacteriales bacterium]|jgi:uncharacterized membrane protein|nr:hypothetical protein [Coriobacteriales bacterium]
MDIVPAILIGIIGGIVGVVPFFVARSSMKKRLKKDGIGSIALGMVATIVSFALMVIEIVLCFILANSYLLPFALSAILVFVLAIGIYTVTLMRR